MPNWKTTYELLRKLEQLAAAPDRTPLWQGVLELILQALEASGGRIERDYPHAVLASVGPEDCKHEFPLLAGGKTYGSLKLACTPPRALSDQGLELARFCAAMAGLTLAGESLDRELDQFVRGATHDLRGSLVRSATTAQILARQANPDSEEHRMADRMVEDLTGAESLLRDLAAFAAAGHSNHTPQPVSISAAVDEARWNKKPALQKRGASLLFESPDRKVIAREPDLVQIFERLVDNSLKFSADAPSIRIQAEAVNGGGTLISVRDNGPGIDPAFAETVFEPFQRLHGKRYPGHGLGLAICQKLVTSLGGEIRVDTTATAGATIHVWLPSASTE